MEDTYYKWPSSLPTHDKIDRAVEKAFELVEHYKALAQGASIRDPCINMLYKVTGGDSCQYWSTGMVSATKFCTLNNARDLIQKISNNLTQNYDPYGKGCC